MTMGNEHSLTEAKERRQKLLRTTLASSLSSQIFNYSTLNVFIIPETKSLDVIIRADRTHEAQWFFEMETLFGWLNTHLEVKSVSFRFDCSSTEFNYAQFREQTTTSVVKYFKRMRSLVHHLINLPQATLIDAQNGMSGPWAEFMMAFDLRICSAGALFHWNHLSFGMTPVIGGIELIESEGLGAGLEKWLMSAQKMSANDAFQMGLISFINFEKNRPELLQRKIKSLSTVARMQMKKKFNSSKVEKLKNSQQADFSQFRGCLDSGDWKVAIEAKDQGKSPDFLNPQTMKTKVKNH